MKNIIKPLYYIQWVLFIFTILGWLFIWLGFIHIGLGAFQLIVALFLTVSSATDGVVQKKTMQTYWYMAFSTLIVFAIGAAINDGRVHQNLGWTLIISSMAFSLFVAWYLIDLQKGILSHRNLIKPKLHNVLDQFDDEEFEPISEIR